jgi:integrase
MSVSITGGTLRPLPKEPSLPGKVTMGDKKSDELKLLLREAGKLNERISRMAGEQRETLFGEFAETYLQGQLLDPTLRDSTKRLKVYTIRKILKVWFGDMPLGAITNTVWMEKVNWVKQNPLEPTGRTTRFFNSRKTLVEIMHAAVEEGLLEKVPKLSNPDQPRKIGRVLKDKEVWAILRNTTYPIFRLFFYAMYRMGCRPKEVLQWEWSMIVWGEPGETWINIPARISKCDRDRFIPIDPKLSKQLYRIYKRGNSSRFVFPNRIHLDRPQLSYHGAWKTATKAAGLFGIMVYDFRRSAITRWLAEGKPAAFVAMILDTSTKMLERVYLKPDKRAMEGIFK